MLNIYIYNREREQQKEKETKKREAGERRTTKERKIEMAERVYQEKQGGQIGAGGR